MVEAGKFIFIIVAINQYQNITKIKTQLFFLTLSRLSRLIVRLSSPRNFLISYFYMSNSFISTFKIRKRNVSTSFILDHYFNESGLVPPNLIFAN